MDFNSDIFNIVLGTQTLTPKKTLQVFFFQLYFNKKCVEVAINDLTMHLIISKCLRNKNVDRREGEWDKKRLKQMRNCLGKCAHSFNYIIDHANVNFFFYANRLHCVVCGFFCTSCCTLSAQIASQVSQVYSHTKFLLEYMNFLKLIHEDKYFVK